MRLARLSCGNLRGAWDRYVVPNRVGPRATIRCTSSSTTTTAGKPDLAVPVIGAVIMVAIWVEAEVSEILNVETRQAFAAIVVGGTFDNALSIGTMSRDTVIGIPALFTFSYLGLACTVGFIGTASRDAIIRVGADAAERDHACCVIEAKCRFTINVIGARIASRRQWEADSDLTFSCGLYHCAALGSTTVTGRLASLRANVIDAKASLALDGVSTAGTRSQQLDVFTHASVKSIVGFTAMLSFRAFVVGGTALGSENEVALFLRSLVSR